jgi:nucleotide-binding universal stress UspA family protein
MTQQDRKELVIVGVDGSPASARALEWAARYAGAVGATMRAVLAWHYPAQVGSAPVGVAPASVSGEIEEGKRSELARQVEEALGDPPAVPVEQKVAYGHPAQVLIDESAGADLLVVGSRGHGGFKGMLLGSVSTNCVTHAACPVTVVRAQ